MSGWRQLSIKKHFNKPAAHRNAESSKFHHYQSKYTGWFENVRINTGIAGRWQIIGEKPFCICDTAHNVDGIKEVVEQIRSLEYSNLHFVLGMVNDKNISTILSLLPKHATYYFCKANIPRGLDQADLMQMANKFNLKGDAYPSVKNCLP